MKLIHLSNYSREGPFSPVFSPSLVCPQGVYPETPFENDSAEYWQIFKAVTVERPFPDVGCGPEMLVSSHQLVEMHLEKQSSAADWLTDRRKQVSRDKHTRCLCKCRHKHLFGL